MNIVVKSESNCVDAEKVNRKKGAVPSKIHWPIRNFSRRSRITALYFLKKLELAKFPNEGKLDHVHAK